MIFIAYLAIVFILVFFYRFPAVVLLSPSSFCVACPRRLITRFHSFLLLSPFCFLSIVISVFLTPIVHRVRLRPLHRLRACVCFLFIVFTHFFFHHFSVLSSPSILESSLLASVTVFVIVLFITFVLEFPYYLLLSFTSFITLAFYLHRR